MQYPQDSLGYCYAASLTEAGFDPEFYRAIAVRDDASYILLRLRQTHDIWHLITGFGTDVAGELGLKAFELAQTRRPMALVLLTFGLLKALLKTPDALATLLPTISPGISARTSNSTAAIPKVGSAMGEAAAAMATRAGLHRLKSEAVQHQPWTA